MIADEMRLVFGIDANYAPHLGVFLKSVAASNAGEKIRADILHDGIDRDLQKQVEFCAPFIICNWIEIKDHRVLDFDGLLQITSATYLRLIILDVLEASLTRILYLDVDMIVNGSLRPLWETDLQGAVCAAVVDPGIDATKFAAKWTLTPAAKYFNAGVILFDLDRLRAEPFMQRAVALLADDNKTFEYADQDALNIVLWDKWLEISCIWNFQRKLLYDKSAHGRGLDAAAPPVIIHFTERQKPWQKSEWHPFAWLYLYNLFQTPFRSRIFKAGKIGPVVCFRSWLRWMIKGRNFHTGR